MGVDEKQFRVISVNPMSLPPMPRVTSSVVADRLSNCGGFGPGDTPWALVMSPVSAPLQLGSWKLLTPSAAATRCG